MIEAGFESRIKIQQIVDNQLPEFIIDESPKTAEFLKQYYISQEYQGGVVDIIDNLDQYLKLDKFKPEVIVDSSTTTQAVLVDDSTISVSSTKGFPSKYGLIKIDDEIITYTGSTTTTFTGCVRGFSGITNYHQELNQEDLIFSTSSASSHDANSPVQNLSSLFLKEFYKKIKYSLTPGLENLNFTENLNVGNFIKEARTFYESKGTEESFRILFNVLYGETPKVVDLEKFLNKPSSSTYIRRDVVVAEAISGNPLNLAGQTIIKTTDSGSTAPVSEVEIINRKGKTYYKLFLFVGFDDAFPTTTGTFNITGSSRNINDILTTDTVITVDSTIGFPESGTLYAGNNQITYTSKSINQFFGCSNITEYVPTASIVRSNETYYGYENGDITKKVELRLTGVISEYNSGKEESSVSVNEKLKVKNLGEIIENPIDNKTYKEIFANSWIYNTSSRYEINSFSSGETSQVTLSSDIDKSSLKVGDVVDILSRNSQNKEETDLEITSIAGRTISLSKSFVLKNGFKYDIRRKLKSSSSRNVNLEFNSIVSDIQNVYNENDEFMYVASNSLPSYEISKNIFSYNASGVGGKNTNTDLYSTITFSSKVSFKTGSEVYYSATGNVISGLSERSYFVEVLSDNLSIRLHESRSTLGTSGYKYFGILPPGTHNFVLKSQKEKVISAQKILRKFPLSVNMGDGKSDLITPGSIGMLVNGVEITSYKTDNKIYYGPLESVNVLSGGSGYDVINPPLLSVDSGTALVQPAIRGSVEKILVEPQDFDIDVIVSVVLTGGNGKGASFEPVIRKKRREIEFNAAQLSNGGGVDVTNETITFTKPHGLVDGEPITYLARTGVSALGIGTFNGSNDSTGETLSNNVTYYTKFISDNTIQLYKSLGDYKSGINTVGFTSTGTLGIQKFGTQVKNTLSEIRVINGGEGYENRKIYVDPSNISLKNRKNSITFKNHGFNSGELVSYTYETSAVTGLSSANQYYVTKIDDDTFKVSDAGIGGTIKTNYDRQKYVRLESGASGYQIFNYPDISLQVNYGAVGLGSTQFRGSISATPIVRGKIVSALVYDQGSDYGSTILNYNKKPTIEIKNGKDSQFIPIISNGGIERVSIQSKGREYYSVPDIIVSGNGTGAELKPVLVNNKIDSIIVVNSGIGYSTSNTIIQAKSAGSGALLDANIRSLNVNNNIFYNDVTSTDAEANEIISSSYNKLQYSICGYGDVIKNELGDVGTDASPVHSPIIGWAYDGNPIYGAFGYSNPKDIKSDTKRLVSGYSKSLSNIPNRPSESSTGEVGFFIEDYKFTNIGDLDEYNGRYCVTPEFPNGTYAYFATAVENAEGDNVGVFPYFIGDRYRSSFVSENKDLSQSFDFNNSNLIRNTFPYKLSADNAENDFIIESNEIVKQNINVESVSKGSIENFNIINSGDNYKVGDTLQFNESETGGSGLIAQVGRIGGKQIESIETTTLPYNDSIFVWNDKDSVKVKVSPRHSLDNLDYVTISGFSTTLTELLGTHQIGVTSYTTVLNKEIPAAGVVTDIYVSRIPNNVSIGSSIEIGSDTFTLLNIFRNQGVLRVDRGSVGSAHSASTTVNFIPDSFTISKSLQYFDSKENDLVYLNPNQSVGVGTTAGIGVAVTYNVGNQTNNIISIPTQSIFLPGHPFKTNQQVTLTKPTGSSSISVANTSASSPFDLPDGDSQNVYIIKKSPDHIGIVTEVGLTTTTNGLFFINNGDNNYKYSLESNFTQITADIKRIRSQVSVSTSHGLTNGDSINLSVQPNLNVGIGTSTSVAITLDVTHNLPSIRTYFNPGVSVDTSNDEITISSHGYKTGDKVYYSYTTGGSIVDTNIGSYYIYKIDDNTFKLCETYLDSTKNPPIVSSLTSSGDSTSNFRLISPQIEVIKGNNLVFDTSDSSLSGYNLKVFYDNEFKDEFISTGSTDTFNVIASGTPGSVGSALTVYHDENIPTKLYYNLEKSGYISTADKEIKNYNEILFVDSVYSGTYNISGSGTTTFNIVLDKEPEKVSYAKTECDVLKYTTNSSSASGSVSDIRTISPGLNYKKIPDFVNIESQSGTEAYVVVKSDTIGKVNQVKIINQGFEYSSDKTLRPEASIDKLITLDNSYTISSINVTNGGKNYLSTPDLIVIDGDTGKVNDSGLLRANLSGNSIISVSNVVSSKGLTSNTIVRAINNTNGIGINTFYASSSGIVTCILTTPATGFGEEPFSTGDKIFVEGLEKSSSDGDGFNSSDYGYNFFTVSSYTNSGVGVNAELEFDISGLTTNPGIGQTVQNVYASIVNFNNYPKFNVSLDYAQFIIGESLEVKTNVGFVEVDLRVSESNKNSIKVSGDYKIKKDDIIRGRESYTTATINTIKESVGRFEVDYFTRQDIGWSDDIGKLNQDTQVIPNNDYYQNLSYTVKSRQKWEDIVSPVNKLLHTSGLKNFADTEIIKNVESGITTSVSASITLVDLINQNRVDTINNFDFVYDVDTITGGSRYLKFKNKRLSDYIYCKTNRVLQIDDISNLFANSEQSQELSSAVDDLQTSRKYNRYLIQITSDDYSEVQFDEIIVLNDDDGNTFTFEKGSISNVGLTTSDHTKIGDISIEDKNDIKVLKFSPNNPYSTDYNIKYLNSYFTSFSSGIGTESFGFIDLTSSAKIVGSGNTSTLIGISTSKIESIHSQIHIIDNTNNNMNYVELFVDHDGTNTNISELYFDTNEDELSSNFIGSFGASISGGILSIEYTNTTDNSIIVRSRNVGFGTTASGIGTYRFKSTGQPDESEKTVIYDALYSNISAASTIKSFDVNTFTSLKSTVKVGVGTTSALHQVMLISDRTNVVTIQHPFLSIGSTSGIGTFGGDITGSVVSLKFYPDPEFSGNLEILTYNELFYSEIDQINVPNTLQYNNNAESVNVNQYLSGLDRTIFDLNYQNTPIFTKSFDPNNASQLNLSTGEFNIPNHFFQTNEELIYRPKSTFVGVGSTPMQYESATGIGSLPSRVFAIKSNNNTFSISTERAGTAVTFVSPGEGNAHEFEMVKKNEKVIISIDNVVQPPLSYSLLQYNVDNNGNNIGFTTNIIPLSGISSIVPNDVLKIGDEYMKVSNVGFGTSISGPISFGGTFPLVQVEREFVGTSASTYSDATTVSLYRGAFNIAGNKIHFTAPPTGVLENRSEEDDNNLPDARSSFGGRVFLKQDYTTNKIYDNISENFTGIGQTYQLTVGGINTTGLGSTGGSGIVLINGIFQSPTTENNPSNNFLIEEDTVAGISSIVFSGITSTDGSKIISESDVNQNQLPRGGMIVSLGSTPGLGYAPLVGASVTAIIAGGSITSIGIGTTGNWGSGYREPVSIAITDSSGGSGADISVIVGAGGTLSFNVSNGGSGYDESTTIVELPSPSYENLSVIGVSRLGIGTTTETGTGLLLNIEIGASQTTGIGSTLFQVSEFSVVRSGYGFKPGDVITAVGLVTDYGLSEPLEQFQLTVLDTFTDQFSSWEFGTLDYIDSIKQYQDGIQKRFSLFYNNQLLSFEKNTSNDDSQFIDMDSLLIIFINGILQQPKESYQFEGGTSFVFTDAPKPEDDVAIYFYRGSYSDSFIVDEEETIKIGDSVQVFDNINIEDTKTQEIRTVSDIAYSDKIQTNLYRGVGIDEVNDKPLYWTKQKVDKIIDGYPVYKTRNSIEPQVYPTAKIIKDVTTTDSTIFVDNSQFFEYDTPTSFDGLIVSGVSDPVSAAVTAVVSAAGTIQSLSIESGGSGYTGSSVVAKISAPQRVGVGIGTTATATITVSNGSLTTPVTITNPGFGYTQTKPPQVIIALPEIVSEEITNIQTVQGADGNITGIGTTVGIGTDLALYFNITTGDLQTGYYIYVSDTIVGNGVTSIIDTDDDIVGIGTTCVDNIYRISGLDAGAGIVTCNIHSQTNVVGIATTTGNYVGKFSWGRLSNLTRGASPISIGVSAYEVSSGLTTFPTIQRRGEGLRNIGPIS